MFQTLLLVPHCQSQCFDHAYPAQTKVPVSSRVKTNAGFAQADTGRSHVLHPSSPFVHIKTEKRAIQEEFAYVHIV